MHRINLAVIAVCWAALPPATASPAPLNLSLTCPNGNPMWLPSTPHPPIFGVIIQFVSKTAAEQRIAATESGNGATIDPEYLDNQRVILQGTYGHKWYVLVPTGMIVHIGEAVSFAPGHADPNDLCLYTPNLILPSQAP